MKHLLILIFAFSFSKCSLIQDSTSGCTLNPDGNEHEWPEWPPLMTDELGDFVLPTGENHDRQINLETGQVILLSCPGSDFDGPGGTELFARCKSGQEFDVWEENGDSNHMEFRMLTCRKQPMDTVMEDGTCGRNGEYSYIEIGFNVGTSIATTISVCHDLATSRTLYSTHTLWDEISAQDHGNDSPHFNPDTFFEFDVNHFYTMVTQKETIAQLVGSDELADKYIGDFDSGLFLARGHLAPNADFMFYSWMDASYHFINVAPQWNIFNTENWMWFEIGTRDFATERFLDLQVYTGTHEVCQLEDVNGNLVNIFLYDGNKLPIPRFYWKILHDPMSNSGVAVVGVNNPHLESIPEDYIICPPLENHPILASVYHPEDIQKGYMWACRVEDLVKAVPEVPQFPAMDLLM